jgi:hypothetical protein
MKKTDENASDSEPAVKTSQKAILGVLVAALIGYFAWQYMTGPLTAGAIAARALSASEPQERLRATLDLIALAQHDRTQGLPNLRHIAKDSNDAAVLELVFSNMLAMGDYDNSFPLYFTALNHNEKKVRAAAYREFSKYGANFLEAVKESYQADDAAADRQLVVQKLQAAHEKRFAEATKEREWAKTNQSKYDASPVVAAASPEEKKDKDAPAPNPMPTPSPTPAPSPPGPTSAPVAPPTPFELQDNPTVAVLIWMCRALAVLVVIVEVAGMLSLIIGAKNMAVSAVTDRKYSKLAKAEDRQPSVAEEVERALARNNSTGMWSRIALLVGGAMAVVALLGAAEMFQIAAEMRHMAVRMDQNVNFLSSRAR